MTHSIAEPNGLKIVTPLGTVFHTGDWKLDPNPVIGKPTEVAAITRMGDEGLLAMVCSTPIPGRSMLSLSVYSLKPANQCDFWQTIAFCLRFVAQDYRHSLSLLSKFLWLKFTTQASKQRSKMKLYTSCGIFSVSVNILSIKERFKVLTWVYWVRRGVVRVDWFSVKKLFDTVHFYFTGQNKFNKQYAPISCSAQL